MKIDHRTFGKRIIRFPSFPVDRAVRVWAVHDYVGEQDSVHRLYANTVFSNAVKEYGKFAVVLLFKTLINGRPHALLYYDLDEGVLRMAWFVQHFSNAAALADHIAHDIVLAIPHTLSCAKCGSQCAEKSFDATVFTLAYTQPVRLLTWRCTACAFVAPWDGREFGIVNMNNVTLLAFELILEYLELFRESGASVSSWWAAKVAHYIAIFGAQLNEVVDLTKTWTGLRSRLPSWIAAFVYLMRIDAAIFDCMCPPGEKLEMVAADGIVLSIAMSRLKTLQQPWSFGESVHRASVRTDRNVDPPKRGHEETFVKALRVAIHQRISLAIALDNANGVVVGNDDAPDGNVADEQDNALDPNRLAAANLVLAQCLAVGSSTIVQLLAVIVTDMHDLVPTSRLKPFIDSIHSGKTCTPLSNLIPHAVCTALRDFCRRGGRGGPDDQL
ncbi:hypothetical protein GGF32_007072, partial [Allomyces javanicus]